VRVIVVGAGFAGLAAAEALHRASVEVDLLEARARVGGRVWSVPFDGAMVERGAEFILPHDKTVIALAERLGLRLVRKGTRYGNREPRGGEQRVTRRDVAAALRQIESQAPPPSGDGTLLGALGAYGLEPGVAEAIRARIEVSCAYGADDLDAGALKEGAASFGDFDTFTVDGGNDRIARELATGLGEAVRLNTPVTRVGWSADGVRVFGGGREWTGDAAVMAVPASVLSDIAFDPPLAPEKAAVRYGQAAKLFVALRTPAPPSEVLWVPGRFWCYTQLGPDGDPAPFVAAFAGSPGALEALEVDAGPERWLSALGRLRPDLELEPDTVTLSTWADDPWARGAYSARSVSSPMDTELLSRPVGPLFFAGEHTAGAWHGLMEGALRSGSRAAQQLVQTVLR
jgi:monoamine oxidase